MQGQRDVKEAHFHRQVPGLIISTAADGFNFFMPHVTVGPETEPTVAGAGAGAGAGAAPATAAGSMA